MRLTMVERARRVVSSTPPADADERAHRTAGGESG